MFKAQNAAIAKLLATDFSLRCSENMHLRNFDQNYNSNQTPFNSKLVPET